MASMTLLLPAPLGPIVHVKLLKGPLSSRQRDFEAPVSSSRPGDAAATAAGELDLHAHDLMPLVALEVVCLEPLEHLGWAMSLGFALCTRRPASTACLPALLGSGEDSDDDVHALC